MKNTLKIVLLIIGLGFLGFGAYDLLSSGSGTSDAQRQLYAMLGVGLLFLVAGFSMGNR